MADEWRSQWKRLNPLPAIQNPDGTRIQKLVGQLHDEAALKAHNAGQSGERHDGGASKMLGELSAFIHGWNRDIPPEWKPTFKQIVASEDPEWDEYQRLRRKFEAQ